MNEFTEKRTSRRININQGIIISTVNKILTGTLINCSVNGMYIKTMHPFPFDSIFVGIHIPFKKEVLEVRAKVVRQAKKDDIYEGIGIEFVNPPKKYLELLIKLCLVGDS